MFPPLFPVNRCHQRVVTAYWSAEQEAPNEFPVNRCHQRVVTAALKAVAAQPVARPVARTPIVASLQGGHRRSKTAEIRCAATERAAQRKHWVFGRATGCALRPRHPGCQGWQRVCRGSQSARSSAGSRKRLGSPQAPSASGMPPIQWLQPVGPCWHRQLRGWLMSRAMRDLNSSAARSAGVLTPLPRAASNRA